MDHMTEKKRYAVLVGQTPETASILTKAGFALLETDNALEGIRKTIRHQPDLLIATMDLPEFNGLDIARILRIFYIDIPVIISSHTPELVELAKKDDYLLSVLGDSEIIEKLPAILAEKNAVTEDKEISYRYQLRQREWISLMSLKERKKILLVDDMRLIRRTNLRILDSEENYNLFSAKDGMDAILKALLINPDLIIADIKMPILDGIEMSQILFIMGLSFPIVFLTSSDDKKDQQKAQNIEGVLGYENKTLIKTPEDFIKKVEDYLKMAKTLEQSLGKIYKDESIEKIIQGENKQGIFLPGSGLKKVGMNYRPPEWLVQDSRERDKDGVFKLSF